LYASGTAIAEHVTEVIKKQPSILSGKDIISAHDVEMAVRQNDPVATNAWNKAMEKLGIAVGIVYQLFSPGVFVFGGGVSNAWDLMRDKLYMSVKNYVYASEFCKVVLKKAEFGKDAGTLGAILLAKKRLMNGKIFRDML
jgi:glucokinase